MAISKVMYQASLNDTPETWMDVTGDSVVASTLISGETATMANGVRTTGTFSPTSIIDDTAGNGDTDKVWSADKVYDQLALKVNEPSSEGTSGQVLTTDGNGGRTWTTVSGGSVTLNYVTPEDYGAVGDGTTDDSEAVQDAVDAGYAVYFASNKTYYLASTVTIDHDCHLFGGENATIKTVTPSGGTVNHAIVVTGTLKKTTTMTTDYTSDGTTANSGNQFTLTDMTDIDVGDLLVVEATDQYYNYSRQYYHMGATLLIGDIYNSHLYTTTNIPYDITNTANTSVKVYSAPTAIIENLNFVSDLDSRGNYKYCIMLDWCKNSIVRNCNISHMDNGLRIYECVNTLVDCVSLSKSKYDNSLSGDGYGIAIYSSSETLVQRVESICSQTCITLSGSITNLNTHIRDCYIGSECRSNAVGSHENCYNTVIENCVMPQVNVLGPAEIIRCRFIKNNRINSSEGISFCGSHNPKWATLKVRECAFESSNGMIYLSASVPQNPVQSFDNIFGFVEVTDCEGGRIVFEGSSSESILSNSIQKLVLKNWNDCYEFYRPRTTDTIENMYVTDCTFGKKYWISDHNDSHGMILSGLYYLDYRNTNPMTHKVHVGRSTYAENIVLPKGVTITVSSSNSSAKYMVCGPNLVSDNASDYIVGSVTGSDGGTLTRTPASGSSAPTISMDSNGNLVYSQGTGTGNYSIYPLGLFYAKESMSVTMSATLINSGDTSGATFYPLIAVVDCSTGKLISRYSGSTVTATAQGATVSYSQDLREGMAVMCYYYCSSAVANSVTTFENASITCNAFLCPTAVNMPFEANRRTGDGTIQSLDGVNNIMCSETSFNVEFGVDYVNNPVGLLPSATGVSF